MTFGLLGAAIEMFNSGSAAEAGSSLATDTIGSSIAAPREIEQLLLRIREPAFGGDAAEPMCYLAVMFPGIC